VQEILIEGHTDSKGTEGYNLALSEKRANAVKRWLVEKGGLDSKKIITRGYGESRPIAPNTNPDGSDCPEGRARNRRVEVYVSLREG
jgi:outer membrane protein OmpA-like peptidoglycan-associated protein